jgi:biopolymer transport protein ExbB
MKKLFTFITLVALLSVGAYKTSFAQEDMDVESADNTGVEMPEDSTALNDSTDALKATEADLSEEEAIEEPETFHQILKRYFIQGSPGFMAIVLLALILGLALVIERIIYLNLATVSTTKLLNRVEESLNEGGAEAAMEVCKDTRGPVASIFYEGLAKYDEGLESVEKAITAYGSVAMSKLEKGLSWISLFIALAPMLGFMGTVIGMIQAFDKIQEMGDINPTVVAGGIKVALLTTVFGLIVAIILQIFYNYIVSKVDSMVSDMEDSSITFMDILAEKKNS